MEHWTNIPWQYVSWSPEDAVKHYLTRISSRIPQFTTMEEKDLNYIKVGGVLIVVWEWLADS